jgi:hypothetical protein
MVAELVGACTGGATITGWAMYLGCTTSVVGLLGALPFLAHVLQLPAARLTARYGARRVALVAVAISRQAFLPLALLPFLPVPPGSAQALLVAAAVLLHGLGIVCNNGWVAWMGELVPPRVRGRYFGRRTAIATAAGATATLAAGALLDAGRTPAVLSALAATSCLAGVVSTVLMARQHGGRPRPHAERTRLPFAAVLRRPEPARLAVFLAVTGVASGLAEPYLVLFMLRERGLGFRLVAAHGVLAAGARVLAAPRWGRRVDRAGGAREVLALSTGLLATAPVLWLVAGAGTGPGALAAWASAAVLGGVGAAGLSVAGLAVPLAVAPPRDRPVYHAVFALAGGLGFGVGALAAARLGTEPLDVGGALSLAGPLAAPFVACAALRAGAVALAPALLVRPGARPTA